MDAVWEYQLSANQWIKYDSNICKLLTDEADKGATSFETDIDGCKVTFDFQHLKQKVSGTKFLKPIRCSLYNKDKEHLIWEYLSGRRRWMSFLPETSKQFEKLHKRVSQADIVFQTGKATVFFDKLKISCNGDEENETFIRRVILDTPHPLTTQPVSTGGDKGVPQSKKRKVNNSGTVNPVDDEVVGKKSKLEKVLKEDEKADKLWAEVDEYVPDGEKMKVFIENIDVYNVMLNMTNIAQNNNKYYIIQLLKYSNTSNYSVFFRWGRVGYKGQFKLVNCGNDLEKAKKTFNDKFFFYTGNNFVDRHNFVKYKGKYDLLEMDHSKPEKAPKPVSPETPIESKLNEKVQSFLKLICDFKKMEEAAKGLSYDINRAPLGKLTKAQIKAGYEALKKIEDFIISGKFGNDFKEAVNEYYTRIPHYFGMKTPPLITTLNELKKELELLAVLTEIEAAVASNNEKVENTEQLHPIDKTYAQLKCAIESMDRENDRFKLIETYLFKTHANQHSNYTMSLKNIYEIKKYGEDIKFKEDLGNRMLLWHGSRLTNWHGILSRGLQIAPKEAPKTGYMFGKGVYFADASSKSANYCYPKYGDTGVLALAEVALGEINPKFKADYDSNKLPEGKSSVKGIGDFGPNPEQFVTLDDGITVPCGELMEQPETKDMKDNDLYFNEYIVYDINQIKLRYLVEVEFQPKK